MIVGSSLQAGASACVRYNSTVYDLAMRNKTHQSINLLLAGVIASAD